MFCRISTQIVTAAQHADLRVADAVGHFVAQAPGAITAEERLHICARQSILQGANVIASERAASVEVAVELVAGGGAADRSGGGGGGGLARATTAVAAELRLEGVARDEVVVGREDSLPVLARVSLATFGVATGASGAVAPVVFLQGVEGETRHVADGLAVHLQASGGGGTVVLGTSGGGGRLALAASAVATVVVLQVLASVEESVRHLGADPVVAGEPLHAVVIAGDLSERFDAATRFATAAAEDIVLKLGASEVLDKLVAGEVEVVAEGIARVGGGGGGGGSVAAAHLAASAASSGGFLAGEASIGEVIAGENLAGVEESTGAVATVLAATARDVAERSLSGQRAVAVVALAILSVQSSVGFDFVAVEAEGVKLVARDVVEADIGVAADATREEDLVVAVIGVSASAGLAVHVEVGLDVVAVVIGEVEAGHEQAVVQSVASGA